MDILRVQKIAQAQAWQRAGRAGRQAAGICYRTYTQDEFDKMAPNPVPTTRRGFLFFNLFFLNLSV